jgi:hypothetical protein
MPEKIFHGSFRVCDITFKKERATGVKRPPGQGGRFKQPGVLALSVTAMSRARVVVRKVMLLPVAAVLEMAAIVMRLAVFGTMAFAAVEPLRKCAGHCKTHGSNDRQFKQAFHVRLLRLKVRQMPSPAMPTLRPAPPKPRAITLAHNAVARLTALAKCKQS